MALASQKHFFFLHFHHVYEINDVDKTNRNTQSFSCLSDLLYLAAARNKSIEDGTSLDADKSNRHSPKKVPIGKQVNFNGKMTTCRMPLSPTCAADKISRTMMKAMKKHMIQTNDWMVGVFFLSSISLWYKIRLILGILNVIFELTAILFYVIETRTNNNSHLCLMNKVKLQKI